MIDFHTHILHDIDDGPSSMVLSLEMADVAVADGITTMVATPHAPGMGRGRSSAQRVQAQLAALQDALKEEKIPLEVLPGSELFFDPHLPDRLDSGEFLTCNKTHTVLVECPIYERLPTGFEQMVFDLQVAGYRVVLAHPERIRDFMDDQNKLIPLIERGVLMQLTSQALTGEQGRNMQQIAETMLTHNLVHLIASDAHGVHPHRPPILSVARQHAAELVGEEAATALVLDTPRALIHDQDVQVPEPQAVQKKRRGWFW